MVLYCIAISCIKDKTTTPQPPVVTQEEVATPAITIPEPEPEEEEEEIKEDVKPVTKVPKPPVKTKKEIYAPLIFNVQLGIHPKQKNWVLFKHGTYVIFPNQTSETDARRTAIALLKSYNGTTVNTRKSQLAKGWIASTTKGIYNYIDRKKMGRGVPEENAIVQKAIENINLDKKELEIVHINRPK